MNEVPFLSFRKTQEALDCSRTFLYNLIDEEKLKPKYIGRKPYFMISDIVSILKDTPTKE